MYITDIDENKFENVYCGEGRHVHSVLLDGHVFNVKRYTVASPLPQSEGEWLEHKYLTDTWRRLKTLEECYARPSDAKRAIYDKWYLWARRNGSVVCGVDGYNGRMFTFVALLKDDTGYYAEIRVTRNNQYITLF